jgi:hypothetical protein
VDSFLGEIYFGRVYCKFLHIFMCLLFCHSFPAGLTLPSYSFSFPSLEGRPERGGLAGFQRARVQRGPSKAARCAVHPFHQRMAGLSFNCARRTSTASPCAFREVRDARKNERQDCARRRDGEPAVSVKDSRPFLPPTLASHSLPPLQCTIPSLTPWHSDCFGVPDRYGSRLHAHRVYEG